MSSDCFFVRVKSVRDTEIILDVLTGTAGGFNDLCASRSFALLLLKEALECSVERLPGDLNDPARRAEASRRDEAHNRAPLVRALDSEEDWYDSETWMRENLDRFITACTLVERRNDLGDEELKRREHQVLKEFGAFYTNQYHRWQPRRWQLCHNYTLRVTLADPKWGAHLYPDIEFGTTAYDVWYEDPEADAWAGQAAAPL